MSKTICARCLLGDHLQGITIDEKGICNVCRRSADAEAAEKIRKKYEAKFADLVSRYRGKYPYDCLVAYSGGKDSTYTLYLVKEQYGLKPLAVTFDNWFQSNRAHENVRKVTAALNVDHITLRPPYHTFQQMIKSSIEKDFYPAATMQRASAVCTTCLAMIRYAAFRCAIEQNIPFVVFGLSPGQAPAVTSVFKANPDIVKKMQDMLLHSFRKRQAPVCESFFLTEAHFSRPERFPYSINPLAFLDYNETHIYENAWTLGWKKPDDTDPNSTNCLLNGFANLIHEKQYGFNPYLFEISHLVREGRISFEEGRSRLETPVDKNLVHHIKDMLELNKEGENRQWIE